MTRALVKLHTRARLAVANDRGYSTETVIWTVGLGLAGLAAVGLLSGWIQEYLADLVN
ncbi:MAG: hypothetical protein WBB91_09765 [Nostocoides sp.]|jgi:hypothetical protein|uniref:hypothetical protein n=1 Tax=Nostocoides sp. TaxID=1917966 RepID=UPI003C72BBF4